jgi:hypothetical protein
MKALQYKIEVTTDVSHGWKWKIEEFCIPSIGIVFNEEHCFLCENLGERLLNAEDKKEIEVDEFTAFNLKASIKTYEECKKSMEEEHRNILSEIQK